MRSRDPAFLRTCLHDPTLPSPAGQVQLLFIMSQEDVTRQQKLELSLRQLHRAGLPRALYDRAAKHLRRWVPAPTPASMPTPAPSHAHAHARAHAHVPMSTPTILLLDVRAAVHRYSVLLYKRLQAGSPFDSLADLSPPLQNEVTPCFI